MQNQKFIERQLCGGNATLNSSADGFTKCHHI